MDKIQKTGKVDEAADEDDEEDFSRFLPVEFLKRIPGVEQSKLRENLRKAKAQGICTMLDICTADIDKLGECFGQKQAREMRSFLERKVDLKELKS